MSLKSSCIYNKTSKYQESDFLFEILATIDPNETNEMERNTYIES